MNQPPPQTSVCGQGAFLTLRCRLLTPDREPPHSRRVPLSVGGTEALCAAKLSGEGTEGPISAASCARQVEAHRDGKHPVLAPGTVAYALYTEAGITFRRAERRLTHDAQRWRTDDCAIRSHPAWMRVARVRRKQTDFDRADAGYTEERGGSPGRDLLVDRQSASQPDRTQQRGLFRGNLAEAEARGEPSSTTRTGRNSATSRRRPNTDWETALAAGGQAYRRMRHHLWRAMSLRGTIRSNCAR